MSLKLVKKTNEYTIYKRGDERYAVQDAHKKAVNGDEKVRILVAEDLIKVTAPAPAPVEPEPEAEEAAAEASEEAAVEEGSAEEAPADEEK